MWGEPLTATDIDGLVTSFSYDGFGREKSSSSSTGSTSTITYVWDAGNDEENSLFRISNETPGLASTSTFYDSFGRPIQTNTSDLNAEITKSTTSYNDWGLVKSQSNPFRLAGDKLTTIFSYDDYGRQNSIDNPTNDIAVSYSADANSYLSVNRTSEEGKSTTTTYDPAANKMSEIDPGSVTTSYQYNALMQPKFVTVGGTVVSSMLYDGYGRQYQLEDKGGFGVMLYDHDAYGQLTDQTDPKGNHTHIDYDILGRPDLVTVAGESVTDYTYVTDAAENGLNQLKSASYSYTNGIAYTNSESYTYDALSRPASKTELINGSTFTHTYDEYNVNDQLVKYTFPSGLQITNSYDTNGFLASITGHNGTVYTVNSSNAYGQVTESTYGNGLTSTNVYDEYGYPVSFKTSDPSIFNMEFDFNVQNGNLNWRKDHHKGIDQSLVETFEYDTKWDRLESITYDGATSLDGSVVTMNYEPNGNIKSKSDVSAENYEYDDTKFYQVNKIKDVIANVTPSETVTYNAAQQPISINQPTGAAMTIQYGADDQRRYSVLTVDGQTTERYYVGDYEVQINPDNTEERIHFIGGGVITVEDETGQRDNYYIHSDHLGSVLAVSDQSGAEYARQSFDAWGRKRNATDWTYDNVTDYEQSWLFRGYTGHEMLPEFGLINMNGRLYDNIVGRMLSPDNYSGHGGTSQGFNRYSYVLNNPLKYTDPSGENPFVAGAIGAGGGALVAGIVSDWDLKYMAVGAVAGMFVGNYASKALGGEYFHGFKDFIRTDRNVLSSGAFSELLYRIQLGQDDLDAELLSGLRSFNNYNKNPTPQYERLPNGMYVNDDSSESSKLSPSDLINRENSRENNGFVLGAASGTWGASQGDYLTKFYPRGHDMQYVQIRLDDYIELWDIEFKEHKSGKDEKAYYTIALKGLETNDFGQETNVIYIKINNRETFKSWKKFINSEY